MAGIIFIGFSIWAICYLFGNLATDMFERIHAAKNKKSENVVQVVNNDEQ